MSTPTYVDPRSGTTYPLSEPRWCGDNRAPLLLSPLPGITRAAIQTQTRSLWRYAAALPFVPAEPITLGEGCTPLIRHNLAGAKPWLKCEWFMPMGSFKERGASVMLSLLRSQGITEVLEDSSGNGGAAVAAYSAAGGMRAKILAPASASAGKLLQCRASGAEVETVPGTREDCAAEALRQSERYFYASHNWHPFFLQGTKTLAYELWEDLGFRAPDNVIMPCGAGSNVLGCSIGFGELQRSGEVARMPRLFIAQPANCAPIARAFLQQDPAPALPTIAEGTAITQPIRMPEVLAAVRASNGGAVMLSEAEIGAALLDLARGGIYVEPTSALAAAAFVRLIESRSIRAEDTTVVVLTGSGLKATAGIARLLGVEL